MKLDEKRVEFRRHMLEVWWSRFGPLFGAEIRKRRVHDASYSRWRWHLDEVFVRIGGETHYLWRAVDYVGAREAGMRGNRESSPGELIRECLNQIVEPDLGILKQRLAVAKKEGVEVEIQKLAHIAPKPDRVVHYVSMAEQEGTTVAV